MSEAKAMDDMLDKMEKLMGKEENSAGRMLDCCDMSSVVADRYCSVEASPYILRPSSGVPTTSASAQSPGRADSTSMAEVRTSCTDKLQVALE